MCVGVESLYIYIYIYLVIYMLKNKWFSEPSCNELLKKFVFLFVISQAGMESSPYTVLIL